jgi:hypothetical protein
MTTSPLETDVDMAFKEQWAVSCCHDFTADFRGMSKSRALARKGGVFQEKTPEAATLGIPALLHNHHLILAGRQA